VDTGGEGGGRVGTDCDIVEGGELNSKPNKSSDADIGWDGGCDDEVKLGVDEDIVDEDIMEACDEPFSFIPFPPAQLGCCNFGVLSIDGGT